MNHGLHEVEENQRSITDLVKKNNVEFAKVGEDLSKVIKSQQRSLLVGVTLIWIIQKEQR